MTDRHRIERLGVNGVEQVFLKMNWAFREQPISDFGIDAHAEPMGEDGPTGQLIALQIKSGASYFKKRGKGFVFYGEERHLTYWRNHILPVYVVLHDPGKDLTSDTKMAPRTNRPGGCSGLNLQQKVTSCRMAGRSPEARFAAVAMCRLLPLERLRRKVITSATR